MDTDVAKLVQYTEHLYLLPGTSLEFKRNFERPILRGRDADASEHDQKRGIEKVAEALLHFRLYKLSVDD